MTSIFGGPLPNWLTHPSRGKTEHHQPAQEQESSDFSFSNAVYYPNWRIYRQQPPSSMSLAHISHVFYAFARINLDGTISLTDDYADTTIEVDGQLGCLNALTAQREVYPQLKIILSIGGGGGSENFAAVAADKSARLAFAQSAREIVDQFGLNGIDIDWEHPSDPQQGHHYIQLLAALRASLPLPTYILTTALPAGEWALKNINLAEASNFLDFINLMAYDFTGPWTKTCGHHAQLRPTHGSDETTCCDSAVTYMLSKGVPSRKVLLGIPAYGRSFLGVTKPGQYHSGHAGEEGTFEYRDLPRPGTEEQEDEHAVAAFCVGGDGGFVTYDNPSTVQLKADFAMRQELGGLFYWTGTGDVSGPRSLVQAGYNALHAG